MRVAIYYICSFQFSLSVLHQKKKKYPVAHKLEIKYGCSQILHSIHAEDTNHHQLAPQTILTK